MLFSIYFSKSSNIQSGIFALEIQFGVELHFLYFMKKKSLIDDDDIFTQLFVIKINALWQLFLVG